MDIMKKIRKQRIPLLGALAGGVAGILYWKFIGCQSGTCPIKSVWYWSMLYGIVLGYLLVDLVMGWIRKKNPDDENTEGE